jgi:hypothetical protein
MSLIAKGRIRLTDFWFADSFYANTVVRSTIEAHAQAEPIRRASLSEAILGTGGLVGDAYPASAPFTVLVSTAAFSFRAVQGSRRVPTLRTDHHVAVGVACGRAGAAGVRGASAFQAEFVAGTIPIAVALQTISTVRAEEPSLAIGLRVARLAADVG